MDSHELKVRNPKKVSNKIWNPGACCYNENPSMTNQILSPKATFYPNIIEQVHKTST